MKRRMPSLDEIFSPRGVAAVGASPTGKGFMGRLIPALKEAGFPAIYPVNPKYTEVFGLKCYPSLAAIPETVDHVIVGVPAESVLALLDECAAKGVKSVHFFTAGFSESGEIRGRDMEREMLSKAKAGGFRLVGPNCVGLFVPRSRLVNGPNLPLEPGPIAFISQSGGHAEDLPVNARYRGLRFSKVVSYGNALDIDENELIEYFTQDSETAIIAAYIEGVKDGRRFSRVLSEAAARKPVVIYKGGRTEAGLRAARSHTASLTSSVAVFDALCRQTNAIPADDVDDLADVLVALRFARPFPQGPGAAVLGTGGGPSVYASDVMEGAGLRLTPLSLDIQSRLKDLLPLPGAIFTNPIDSLNLLSPETVSAAMRLIAQAPGIDMLVYHLGFHPTSYFGEGKFISGAFLEGVTKAFAEIKRATGKPVLLTLRPPPDLNGMREFLAVQESFVAAGFPVFHSLHNLARTMARLAAWNLRAGV